MSDSTIPDALAADLRQLFLASNLPGVTLTADQVRLRNGDGEPPSPRLVFLTEDPLSVAQMDGTATVPVVVEYSTSRDRVTAEDHQAVAGKIDDWFRSIRAAKRRGVIVSRIYLHDLVTKQPSVSIDKEDREQTTAIRGELVVTLVAI